MCETLGVTWNPLIVCSFLFVHVSVVLVARSHSLWLASAPVTIFTIFRSLFPWPLGIMDT